MDSCFTKVPYTHFVFDVKILMMKTEKQVVKINVYVGIIYQFLTLIIGMVMRKYIVKYLGVYNLGVIGVFENIMSMMNLLNFGVGSSCMYYLYKYFAKQDVIKISEVYTFYRDTFKKVALGILIIGLIIMFNIQFVIDIEDNRLFLQVIFGAFLAKTVLYNLLICPRTCLQCDGNRYIGVIGDLIAMVLFMFLKIFFLVKTGNLLIYILLLTIEMIFSACFVYYFFLKEYKYIDRNAKIDASLKRDIFNYSKSVAFANINYFVYSSTDNIVLSKFCGTIVVGFLSNYYMIFNAINGFITQTVNAIEAQIIKNYNAELTDKISQYNLSLFFCFIIGSFCVTCLNTLTNDFINLFFGEDLTLDISIVYLMSTILFITIMKKSSNMVVVSMKLVNKEVPFTTAMMITNISLSIILANIIGSQGVLIGTIISELILFAGDEMLALNSNIGLNINIFFKKIQYAVIVVIESIIANYLTIDVNNYFHWLINAFICTIIVVVFILVFYKTKEFKDFYKYIAKKN